MFFLLLTLLITIHCRICYASEGCQAPVILAKDTPPSVELPFVPPHHRSKRATITKLRIHLDYQSSFNSLPGSDVIKTNVIEVAKAKIEATIKAKNPISSKLLVERQCNNLQYRKNSQGVIGCAQGCESQTKCASIIIPDKYLKQCTTITSSGTEIITGSSGDGVLDTDLVILVTSESCSSGTTIAYAAGCFMEKSLDRPILGILNVCSGYFEGDTKVIQNIAVIQHEIIHVLGFSVDKFAYFRHRNGDPIVPRNIFNFPDNGIHSIGVYDWTDKIATTVIRSRSYNGGTYRKPMNALTLPNVVRAAREHFNCFTLNAVDLEDAGGLGSSYSHFDEYFLNEELMTPTVNGFKNPFSDMTLAFLYDTGWYDVDFSKGEILDYGKNKGCDLPTMGCYKYIKSRSNLYESMDPFCDIVFGPGQTLKCSKNKKFYEFCNLYNQNSVDIKFQYFSNTYIAGSNEYNEFCPVYMTLTDPSSNCEDSLNTGKKSKYATFSNYFGSDSKCFAAYTKNASAYFGATCMQYQCNHLTSQYSITYNGKIYQCADSNEHVIAGSRDTLKCASFASVCQYAEPTKKIFVPISVTDSGSMTRFNHIFLIISLLVWYFLPMH